MPWDAVSWTVLEANGSPVGAVDRFLGFLSSSEKSPNTVKSYAHDLKDWFCYLSGRGLAWDEVSLEDVASFVAWLRLPPRGRDGTVAVLGEQAHHCGASTVNRKRRWRRSTGSTPAAGRRRARCCGSSRTRA